MTIVPEARISSMVAEIIAENLIANQKLEEELWNEQKEKAAEIGRASCRERV